MRESKVESIGVTLAEKRGLIIVKQTSPGRTGWPDRGIYGPYGLHWLWEAKAPLGVTSARQKLVHRDLAEIGWKVFLGWDRQSVLEMFKKIDSDIQAVQLSAIR